MTLCHIGFTEHMFEVSQRLIVETPAQHRAYVLFFRVPPHAKERVERLAVEFPGQAFAQESLHGFDSHCTVVVLPVERPLFNAEDLRVLTQHSDMALLGHFRQDCWPEAHGCRFFHTMWHAITGDTPTCGAFFCAAVVPTESLFEPLFGSVDCPAMLGPEAHASGASQWQQDWFVYQNFVRGSDPERSDTPGSPASRQGVFVDVGAFHPIHLSNTLFFERCLGWRGLCVEPNPNFSPYFEAYRPNSELVRNCVWSRPRTVHMAFAKDPIEAYIQDDDESSGAPGLGAVQIGEGGTKHAGFPAECRTLDDILSSKNLRRPAIIDFMSVDAEAAEVEIFRGFRFADFDIRVINVEVQASNYYELDLIFFTAGYAKAGVMGGDHVYSKISRSLRPPDNAAAWHETLAKDFYAHGAPQSTLAKGR